jgi:hypothetical protein
MFVRPNRHEGSKTRESRECKNNIATDEKQKCFFDVRQKEPSSYAFHPAYCLDFNSIDSSDIKKTFEVFLFDEPKMALWHGGVCVLLAMVVLFDGNMAAPGTGVCTDFGTNLRCHQLCNMEVANTTASAIIVTGGVLDLRCPISSQVKVGAFYYYI